MNLSTIEKIYEKNKSKESHQVQSDLSKLISKINSKQRLSFLEVMICDAICDEMIETNNTEELYHVTKERQ